MASKEKITAVVGMLCEAFNRKPTALTFQAYRIGLDGIGDSALEVAATRVLASSEFMPSPGRLRQIALTGGASYEARADIAWNEFDRAVAHHGGDTSVTFADGLINATVTLLGGWIQCCEKSGDEYFVWLQKSFKETYVRLCESPRVASDLLRPLLGRVAVANAGFPTEFLETRGTYTGQPVLVGTSQAVLMPPAPPTKRIERVATDGPKRIGECLRLPAVIQDSTPATP